MANRIRGYVRDPATGAGQSGVTVALKNHNGGGTITSDSTDANGLYEMTSAAVGYPGETYEEFVAGSETKIRSGRVWGQLGGLIWEDTINDTLQALGEGVIPTIGGELAVTADGADMQVDVATGVALLHDGVPYVLEAGTSLTIGTADVTNPRIDRIVLQLVREGTTDQGRIDLEIKAGNPASSPGAPSLTQSSSVWEISLAQVLVGANVTTIAADKVTDERVYGFHYDKDRNTEWAFSFGDGANAITAGEGATHTFRCPYDCDPTGFYIWSPDATVSCVIDVLKGSSPGSMASIAGTEKPSLTTAAANAVASDTNLTSWSTGWKKEEYIRYTVTSNTNGKRIYLTQQVRKR